MSQAMEFIFTHIWWTWNPNDQHWFSRVYHWFNLLEGLTWLVFSVLVIKRFLKHFHSNVEIAYSIAFLTFAATDFREAWEQSSWLIWLKVINLVMLVLLRRRVMQKWYLTSRVY